MDDKVREFYDKLDFLTVIKGNKDLNEWRMNLQHYSLIKDLYNTINFHELRISSILATPSPYFRREYEFHSENKEEMIRHMNQCRYENVIGFENPEREKVILTVMGQPDQPIGQLDGDFCVPGIYPAISGLELSNKECELRIRFENIEEIGKCELNCKNIGTGKIVFDLETKSLPNVRIRGIPEKLELNSNEDLVYRIRIDLEEKFNNNIFNYTSFETIPITTIFKDEGRKIQPFHISINFWYHLLTKTKI